MCLVKVRQEEDIAVPYRVVSRPRSRSPRRRASTQRYSRTVIEEHRPRSSTHVHQVISPPPQVPIPPPQPQPIFVSPPPSSPSLAPPPPASHHSRHSNVHYVEVSPHSSVTSHSDVRSRSHSDVRSSSRGDRSDYYTREVRRERTYRRDRSSSRSSSGEPRYQTYQYIDAPRRDERADFKRSRSQSRGGYEYEYDDRGPSRTRERKIIIEDDRRRSHDYRR